MPNIIFNIPEEHVYVYLRVIPTLALLLSSTPVNFHVFTFMRLLQKESISFGWNKLVETFSAVIVSCFLIKQQSENFKYHNFLYTIFIFYTLIICYCLSRLIRGVTGNTGPLLYQLSYQVTGNGVLT